MFPRRNTKRERRYNTHDMRETNRSSEDKRCIRIHYVYVEKRRTGSIYPGKSEKEQFIKIVRLPWSSNSVWVKWRRAELGWGVDGCWCELAYTSAAVAE